MGPWHYYVPPYPPPECEGPAGADPPGPRAPDAEKLIGNLRQLEEEIARVRRDLDEFRGAGGGER